MVISNTLDIPKLRLNYFPNTTINKLLILGDDTVIEEFEENPEQISTLCICGNRNSLLSFYNMADYISKFEYLNALSIPFFLIEKLKSGDIPNSVNVLKIDITEDFKQKDNNINWPTDVILPNITSIIFSFCHTASRISNLFGIHPHNFPNLRYLNCKLDKNGKILDYIKPFNHLSFLEVEHIGNNSLFDVIPDQLKNLIIVDTGRDFQTNGISRIRSLEAVLFNSIKAEIDCSIFNSLSHLKELTIWNSKRITNIEALLECKCLKKISIINCGNPLKNLLHRFLST